MSDSAERYCTRFSGYDLTTLHAMTACRDAVYDTDEHRWRIAADAVPAGLPAVVPDVDWEPAHAAIQASAPRPRRARWSSPGPSPRRSPSTLT